MNLIWHNFKKDVRRFWVLTALWLGVTGVNCLFGVAAPAIISHSDLWMAYQIVSLVAPILSFLILVVLISLTLQDDPLVGTTSFWLTRPISRKNLLLSKLLFVSLVVLLPTMLGEAIVMWFNSATAIQVGLAMLEALIEQTKFLVIVSALAVLTPTFARFAIAGILYCIGTGVLFGGLIYVLSKISSNEMFTGYWLPSFHASRDLAEAVLTLVIGGLIIGAQFLTRRTRLVAGAAIAGAILAICVQVFFPWNVLDALDKFQSAGHMGFDPDAVRLSLSSVERRPVETAVGVSVSSDVRSVANPDSDTHQTNAPNRDDSLLGLFRVDGLPNDINLTPQMTQASLRMRDGTMIKSTNSEQCARICANEMTPLQATLTKTLGQWHEFGKESNVVIAPKAPMQQVFLTLLADVKSHQVGQQATGTITSCFAAARCQNVGRTPIQRLGIVGKGADATYIVYVAQNGSSVTLRMRTVSLMFQPVTQPLSWGEQIMPCNRWDFALVNPARSNEVIFSMIMPNAFHILTTIARLGRMKRLNWVDFTLLFPSLETDWLKDAELIAFKKQRVGSFSKNIVLESFTIPAGKEQ
ncbi:MAG: hypothetical protein V1899_02420 [Planctomycetota bacterium]